MLPSALLSKADGKNGDCPNGAKLVSVGPCSKRREKEPF